MAKNTGKSVLLVIPHYNFRDTEYLSIKENLERNGAKITVASTVKKNAQGMDGLTVDPDLLIDEANPQDYDAVIFIGGTGASQYWYDMVAHEMARAVAKNGGVLGAISQAAATLAVAGLLKDRKATGHISVHEKLVVLKAQYTGNDIEVDDHIITAAGAHVAKDFAEKLAQYLNHSST